MPTVLFLAGISVGFRVLIHFLQTGQVSPFIPSAILTAVLMILGFQVVFLGLVADMMGTMRSLVEEASYYLRAHEIGRPKDSRNSDDTSLDGS